MLHGVIAQNSMNRRLDADVMLLVATSALSYVDVNSQGTSTSNIYAGPHGLLACYPGTLLAAQPC